MYAMPCLVVSWYMNNCSSVEYVGVIMQPTQLTTATISQRKIPAWMFWIAALRITMSCMSSRAIHIAWSRVEMSRDSVLVMFFYMRLEKHVCNAMSHDLLLALAVVSFDHFITSTHSSDICCNFWPEWESCRTSFAGDFSPIPGDIHYCA